MRGCLAQGERRDKRRRRVPAGTPAALPEPELPCDALGGGAMRNWGVVISGFYVLAVATLSPAVMALIRSIDDTGAMSRLPNAYSAEWYAWAWIAVAGSRRDRKSTRLNSSHIPLPRMP